jgi:hypothetical protein
MGLASTYMNDISKVFDDMANVKLNDDQLRVFIEDIFINKDYVENKGKVSTRAKNLVDSIYNFATNHPTQVLPAPDRTLYGAYNSVSGYFGHMKGWKSPSARMESICFGYGANKTNQAFALANKSLADMDVLNRKPIC